MQKRTTFQIRFFYILVLFVIGIVLYVLKIRAEINNPIYYLLVVLFLVTFILLIISLFIPKDPNHLPYRKYYLLNNINKPYSIFVILVILSFLVPFIILQLPFKYSNEISVSFFEMLIGTSLLYSGICAVKNKEIPGYIVYSWMQNKSAERFGTIFIIIGSLLAIGGLIKLLLLLV